VLQVKRADTADMATPVRLALTVLMVRPGLPVLMALLVPPARAVTEESQGP